MAFSDEMIRALAKTDSIAIRSRPRHVLIQRRDKIGRTYLTAINPVVNVAPDQSGR
jgi:hypothetical protein